MDEGENAHLLPRVTNRGNPPRIDINSGELLNLGVSTYDLQSPHRLMRQLYIEQQRSQTEIAGIFDVQPQTVNRWLKRLEIPLRSPGDSVSMASSKYAVHSFNGSLRERAYLVGLRAGDLHAQKHGRRIRVSVGTTHPAMMDLFRALFANYGEVRKYPKFSQVSGFHWCIYCDLDSSFDFLLLKTKTIPESILEDDDLFLSFLSGYFDAEGCISFDLRPAFHSVSWIVQSSDYGILRDVTKRLNGMGLDVRFRLALEAGEGGCNSDFWRVRLGNRAHVWELLRRLGLRHPEKIAKTELVRSLVSSDWKGGWAKAMKLRSALRDDVQSSRRAAMILLTKRSSEEVWTMRATSRPPQSSTVRSAGPRCERRSPGAR